MNVLSVSPTLQLALTNAQQCIVNRDYRQAHKILTELIQQYPENGAVNLGMGSLCKEVHDFDKAITFLSKACRLLPTNYHAIFELMDTFEAINSHQDTATLHDFTLKQFPTEPEVLYRAALYCSETGQFTPAQTYCLQCIHVCEKLPNLALLLCYAWFLLIKLDPAVRNNQSAAILKLLLENHAKQSQEAMILHYALGEIFHHMDQAEAAFTHWSCANTIQGESALFDTHALQPFFQEIQAAHKVYNSHDYSFDNNSDKSSRSQPIPIFIIGLPRTGSTLLENMLIQHSKIDSIGESAFVSEHLARFMQQNLQQPYPQFMHTLMQNSAVSMDLIEQARSLYKNELSKRQVNAPFVIDKLPANFQSIGLIKRIFPYAKIIDIKRDTDDVAFSIFRHHFANNEPYFCDLNQLHEYRSLYQSMMTYWDDIFGEQILSIAYEDIVTQPTQNITKTLQYIGLDFEVLCANSVLSNTVQAEKMVQLRPIKTLSAMQVRAPITINAIGSAKPYKNYMNKILKRNTV